MQGTDGALSQVPSSRLFFEEGVCCEPEMWWMIVDPTGYYFPQHREIVVEAYETSGNERLRTPGKSAFDREGHTSERIARCRADED